MHKTFGDLIRDLVEVNVDDIIVKVKSRASSFDNFALVFDRLCLTRTKLNPNKCVFVVTVGKLLGFLVSYRGIEANPEEDQDNRGNAASCSLQRRAEAHEMLGRVKPVYF
jgi:hypothetical protein